MNRGVHLPAILDGSYYNKFSTYLRRLFGERVQKISLHAGFTCPNRDGKISSAGCVFCDNKAFSIPERLGVKDLEQQIIQGIAAGKRRYKARKFIAYFQSYTNTYGHRDFLQKQYDHILPFDEIVGLSISTRPDCIDEDILGLISEYSDKRTVWMEYGLQSSHDRTLKRINRGHTFNDFLEAVHLTENFPLRICCHIILGLPDETREDMVETARRIAQLPLDSVKIHPLHVVVNTPLAKDFRLGKIDLLTHDEYVNAAVSFLEYLPSRFVIQRISADADRSILLAPEWMHDKNTILKDIDREFNRRGSYQGKFYHGD